MLFHLRGASVNNCIGVTLLCSRQCRVSLSFSFDVGQDGTICKLEKFFFYTGRSIDFTRFRLVFEEYFSSMFCIVFDLSCAPNVCTWCLASLKGSPYLSNLSVMSSYWVLPMNTLEHGNIKQLFLLFIKCSKFIVKFMHLK